MCILSTISTGVNVYFIDNCRDLFKFILYFCQNLFSNTVTNLRLEQNIIDKIRDSVRLEDIAARYIPSLKLKGKHYIGLCPFHKEKNEKNNYIFSMRS
jgi:hypothetical protein